MWQIRGRGIGRCIIPVMDLTVVQIQWCNYRVISIPVNYVLDIWPEDNYPHGRKALHMSRVWAEIRAAGRPGVLWLDPDVAADPDDLAAMAGAVARLPDDMHTGAVKLWPASTGRDDWIWSHRGGTLGSPVPTQDESVPIAYIAQGMLYTPGRLLDLVFPRHEGAQWAEVDVILSEYALAHGIPAHLVAGCRPKHLHFQGDHDGDSIRQRSSRTVGQQSP